MISTPLKLSLTTAALLLLALLAGSLIQAQDDAPITISDGSLKIESAVPWANFSNPDGRTKVHPHTGKAVTQVAIAMPGHNQVLAFSGQKCTVTVTYAKTDVVVTTGNNGRGVRINTDFSSFRNSSANVLEHNTRTAKISRVVVARGNQNIFDNTASGGTKIVISYK
jgi:hypothetical protein